MNRIPPGIPSAGFCDFSRTITPMKISPGPKRTAANKALTKKIQRSGLSHLSHELLLTGECYVDASQYGPGS
jgi:hypothetical protein